MIKDKTSLRQFQVKGRWEIEALRVVQLQDN